MNRWPWLAVAWISLLSGCRWLGIDRDGFDEFSRREIAAPKISPASVETAARVDRIGRQLVAASPFLGIDPTFQTIGGINGGPSAPEIFHRDSTGVFMTEGLVNLCRKDDELAAVLANELGNMAAEARRTERLRVRDPIPAAAMGGKPDGSTGHDVARDMYLAEYEKNVRKPTERKMFPVTDAAKIARQLLIDAGFDPKCLDEVQPILKQANRTQTLAKQLGGASAAPNWRE